MIWLKKLFGKNCDFVTTGPMQDYRRVASQVSASATTSLRPREYDIDALKRATDGFPEGLPGVALRLLACDTYLDCGDTQEAIRSLMDAEVVYSRTRPLIPANCIEAFVFGHAFLRCDAVTARQWWNRLAALRAEKTEPLYWLAKSALAWCEGQRVDAEVAWKIGNAISARRPMCGASAASRESYLELRRAIEGMDEAGNLDLAEVMTDLTGELTFAVAAGQPDQPLMMDKAESFASAGPLGAAFCSE